MPGHAIELASVYLDPDRAAVLARARHDLQMMTNQRCGDHLVAAHVAHVDAMKRQFLRLAADAASWKVQLQAKYKRARQYLYL